MRSGLLYGPVQEDLARVEAASVGATFRSPAGAEVAK